MQPQKEKKFKGDNLLKRLQLKHKVELGMEIPGFSHIYNIEGTKDKKLLVSYDGEFIGSGKNIKEAIERIAIFERKSIEDYDLTKVRTTYVEEEENVDTKMYEEKIPNKITARNGINMYGKQFYIAKKKPDGSSSGEVYCLYNFKTRNLLAVHWDRDILLGWLMTKYKEIEEKDV